MRADTAGAAANSVRTPYRDPILATPTMSGFTWVKCATSANPSLGIQMIWKIWDGIFESKERGSAKIPWQPELANRVIVQESKCLTLTKKTSAEAGLVGWKPKVTHCLRHTSRIGELVTESAARCHFPHSQEVSKQTSKHGRWSTKYRMGLCVTSSHWQLTLSLYMASLVQAASAQGTESTIGKTALETASFPSWTSTPEIRMGSWLRMHLAATRIWCQTNFTPSGGSETSTNKIPWAQSEIGPAALRNWSTCATVAKVTPEVKGPNWDGFSWGTGFPAVVTNVPSSKDNLEGSSSAGCIGFGPTGFGSSFFLPALAFFVVWPFCATAAWSSSPRTHWKTGRFWLATLFKFLQGWDDNNALCTASKPKAWTAKLMRFGIWEDGTPCCSRIAARREWDWASNPAPHNQGRYASPVRWSDASKARRAEAWEHINSSKESSRASSKISRRKKRIELMPHKEISEGGVQTPSWTTLDKSNAEQTETFKWRKLTSGAVRVLQVMDSRTPSSQRHTIGIQCVTTRTTVAIAVGTKVRVESHCWTNPGLGASNNLPATKGSRNAHDLEAGVCNIW